MIKHVSFLLPVASKDERLQSVLDGMPTSLAARAMFVRSALAYGLFYLNNIDASRFNSLSSEISFCVYNENVEFKRFRLLREATPERVFIHIKMLAPMALKVYVTTSLILFSEMLDAETFFSHFPPSTSKPSIASNAAVGTNRLSGDDAPEKAQPVESPGSSQLDSSRVMQLDINDAAMQQHTDLAINSDSTPVEKTATPQLIESEGLENESSSGGEDPVFTDVLMI